MGGGSERGQLSSGGGGWGQLSAPVRVFAEPQLSPRAWGQLLSLREGSDLDDRVLIRA